MLDLSKLVGFDTETYPTIASLPLPEGLEHLEEYRSMAPPMVCGQFFGLSEFIDPLCHKLKDPHHKIVQGDCTGVLVTPEDAARMFMWLSQRKAVFTAANLAYDALVMEVEFPGLLPLVALLLGIVSCSSASMTSWGLSPMAKYTTAAS